VFVGSDDTNLYAVDIETGSQQWAFETDAEIRSSPTVVDGTVFIGSDDDNLYAVDAETGSQEWAFKTDAEVRSSPTVAGGTVFVGSFDGDLHAVDIETGSQQWAFETDAEIRSSPTVVSGTVFVGSYDTNLYAVKCYVGSSDGGSRVSLGTLGHHDEWRYTDQSITIPAYAFYTSWVRTNIELLGVGGVATGGYGAWRWWSSRQATTPTSDETESTQAGNSEQAGSEGSGSIESEQSIIEGLREQADIALESAETAREHNDLSAARDDYEKALETYQAAVDELSVGQADTRTELEAAIESTCQALDEVMTLHEAHGAIVETLQPAERSLQEAIVAYIENDQTVARIRFRQARDTFEDAHETIVENEVDLLTDPVAVDVQPDREPASTTISDLPVIPEVAATELADVGIETIDDLDGRDESPWTPAAVEKLVGDGTIDEDVATALTLMSWWHGDVSYTFETAEEVERRQQQTDYGFNQSS
jgi:predicted negative regulator of RcsB-dependent stress response